jgi:hypothetical protein
MKSICAMSATPVAIPLKPNSAETIAIRKKVMAQFSTETSSPGVPPNARAAHSRANLRGAMPPAQTRAAGKEARSGEFTIALSVALSRTLDLLATTLDVFARARHRVATSREKRHENYRHDCAKHDLSFQ